MGDWTLGGTPFGVILFLSLRVAVCGAIIGYLVIEPISIHAQKKYTLDTLEFSLEELSLEESGEPLMDDVFVCIRKIYNSRILGFIPARTPPAPQTPTHNTTQAAAISFFFLCFFLFICISPSQHFLICSCTIAW